MTNTTVQQQQERRHRSTRQRRQLQQRTHARNTSATSSHVTTNTVHIDENLRLNIGYENVLLTRIWSLQGTFNFDHNLNDGWRYQTLSQCNNNNNKQVISIQSVDLKVLVVVA